VNRPYHRILVDHQPVVVVDILKIDDMHATADGATFVVLVIHLDAVGEHVMEGVVVEQKGGLARAHQQFECFFLGGGRNGGIEALDGEAQAVQQERLLVIQALGRFPIAGDIRTEGVGVAQLFQPVNGSLLDDGFGKGI
jgi:hypothetical protein